MPIAASLILPKKLMIHRENPAKNPSLGNNFYSVLYIVHWCVQVSWVCSLWTSGMWQRTCFYMRAWSSITCTPPTPSYLTGIPSPPTASENLLLHEGMVFDHVHTSYAKLLNRNLISTQSI
jgi:hypothetical protein